MRSVFVAILLCACSKPSPTPSPSPAPIPSPSPTPSLTPAKQVVSSKDIGALAARLRYEAAHRPASGLKAEQVLDAMGAAGLALPDRRQFLGLTAHASYCAGGTTKEGVGISVCEYATPADATAAKAFVDHQYAFADTTRISHGTALLSVVGSRDAAERATRAFQAL